MIMEFINKSSGRIYTLNEGGTVLSNKGTGISLFVIRDGGMWDYENTKYWERVYDEYWNV